MRLGTITLFALLWAMKLAAQMDDAAVVPVVLPAQPALSSERIFGVIPSYQFVEKPEAKLPPLSPKQKFVLFVKETVDPFTIVGALAASGYSHMVQDDPVYGEGAGAYGQRLGAAYTDVAVQNFFSDALLATLFKEDPRYFRLGPKFNIWKRVGYSLSRVAVCRTDAGNSRVCLSSLLGTTMGIGLSNAYYPKADQNGREMLSREAYSFSTAALSNLLPEFWPDIKARFFTPKAKKDKP
jgi:hypothetical protein